MSDTVIDNDLISFNGNDLDPATGEPKLVGSAIVATDSLSETQVTELGSLFPDNTSASFNNNGDIVGTDGAILMAKADVDVKRTANAKPADADANADVDDDAGDDVDAATVIANNEGKVIEIAGVDYQITNGTAVGADGVVKFDKAALLAEVEGSMADDTSADIETIAKLTGLTVLDDKGDAVEYSDDLDGISKYISDVVAQESNKSAEASSNAVFEAYPQLQDAYNYIRLNGTLEDYGSVRDHSGITLDKTNDEQLSAILIEAEVLRGNTIERAQRILGYAKDDNRLYDEAVEALKYIQIGEADEVEQRKLDVIANDQQATADAVSYWDGIKATINTGELQGYIIPENVQVKGADGRVITKSRDDFYNYVSQSADANGNSAAALDRHAKGADLELLMDYIMFTGGDLSKLIDLQVKKVNATNTKLKFGKHNTSKLVIHKAPDTNKADNNNIKFK